MSDVAKLVASLESGDAAQRQAAAEELSSLGTDAQPAAAALVAACGDEQMREPAVAALEDLGPPSPSDVARLAALLARPSLDVAYWAATLLGRLEGDAAPAVPALITALEKHSGLAVRQRAAWALGKIGPPAVAARTALNAAATNNDARLAALAREAIAALGD
jgi:HEAT repeat protein